MLFAKHLTKTQSFRTALLQATKQKKETPERGHVFLILYANLFVISGIVLGIVLLGTYFQKISWLVLVYNSGVSLLQFCCSKDSEGNYRYMDRQNSFLHSSTVPD